MGGAQTVSPRRYISAPSMEPMAAILAQRNQQALMQIGMQSKMLDLASKVRPQLQEFDAARVSQEAGEMGMANLARSRKYEQMVSPEAAKMRKAMGGRVAAATSPQSLQRQMNEWARTKGLMAVLPRGDGLSGIDPNSTIARSAMFDRSSEAYRQAELANLAAQQAYLTSNAAPMGGLDPGALASTQQAVNAANAQTIGGWQQGLLGAAQGLGNTAGDLMNQSMAEIANAYGAHSQNRQNYEQALYQAAAQNAASNNAMLGNYIGLGGAALGAVAIAY